MLSQIVFVLRATASKQHEDRLAMFSLFVFVKRMQAFPDDRKSRRERITHTTHHTPHAPHMPHMSRITRRPPTQSHTDTPAHKQTPTHTQPSSVIPAVYPLCLNSYHSHIQSAARKSHWVNTICGHHTKVHGVEEGASSTCDQQFAVSRELTFHDTVSPGNSSTIQ